MPDFVLPSIHLNGTSRATLAEGYHNAYRKLLAFRDAFSAIEFNARDFYVQGPGAWTRACDQRNVQRQRIADLMTYLEAHLIELGE